MNGAYLSSLSHISIPLPFSVFYPSCRKVGKKSKQMDLDYRQSFSSIIQQLFHAKLQPLERTIKAHFGLNLPMLSRIYNILSSHPHRPQKSISPTGLLVALHFLKLYETEDVSRIFFRISGKT